MPYQQLREVLDIETHSLGGSFAEPAKHSINIADDDLIGLRRNNSGSGNPRDIEGTLYGSEIAKGLSYADKRQYVGPECLRSYYEGLALSGQITDKEILAIFPRLKGPQLEVLVTMGEYRLIRANGEKYWQHRDGGSRVAFVQALKAFRRD